VLDPARVFELMRPLAHAERIVAASGYYSFVEAGRWR
jgi:hypothetical protein